MAIEWHDHFRDDTIQQLEYSKQIFEWYQLFQCLRETINISTNETKFRYHLIKNIET